MFLEAQKDVIWTNSHQFNPGKHSAYIFINTFCTLIDCYSFGGNGPDGNNMKERKLLNGLRFTCQATVKRDLQTHWGILL
jgi:hypothetical protein